MTKCLAPMWREEVTPLDPIFAVRAGAPEGREGWEAGGKDGGRILTSILIP